MARFRRRGTAAHREEITRNIAVLAARRAGLDVLYWQLQERRHGGWVVIRAGTDTVGLREVQDWLAANPSGGTYRLVFPEEEAEQAMADRRTEAKQEGAKMARALTATFQIVYPVNQGAAFSLAHMLAKSVGYQTDLDAAFAFIEGFVSVFGSTGVAQKQITDVETETE